MIVSVCFHVIVVCFIFWFVCVPISFAFSLQFTCKSADFCHQVCDVMWEQVCEVTLSFIVLVTAKINIYSMRAGVWEQECDVQLEQECKVRTGVWGHLAAAGPIPSQSSGADASAAAGSGGLVRTLWKRTGTWCEQEADASWLWSAAVVFSMRKQTPPTHTHTSCHPPSCHHITIICFPSPLPLTEQITTTASQDSIAGSTDTRIVHSWVFFFLFESYEEILLIFLSIWTCACIILSLLWC